MIPTWQNNVLAHTEREVIEAEVGRLCVLSSHIPTHPTVLETLCSLRKFYMDSFEPGATTLAFEPKPPKDAIKITLLARELNASAFQLSKRLKLMSLEVKREEVLLWMKTVYEEALNRRIKSMAMN